VKEFDAYRVYYAGEEVGGVSLEQVEEEERGREEVQSTDWNFYYGDCTPPAGEGGCAPPLQIQNASSCRRWAGLYQDKPRLFDFRGAKAAWTGGNLEVYTGRTTVVIYAFHRRFVKAAARRLRDVHQANRQSLLPPPAPGSLWGNLPCQMHPD